MTGEKMTSKDAVWRPEPYFSNSTPEFVQTVLEFISVFIAIHYLQWLWAGLILLYVLHYIGLGMLSVALVVVYLPSLFNGAHKKPVGGKQWESFRQHKAWNVMANYVGFELTRQEPLDPSKQYIFGYHPHGILVLSRISYYGGTFEKMFPGIAARVLAASPMFFVPLARELCMWLNAVDASRRTAEKILNSKLSIMVYPGGSKEIFKTNPNSKETTLVLKNRMGFLKLAMRYGVDLVPTFVFGEKWLYSMWNPPKFLQSLFLDVLKVPLILFWGRFCTWMPYKANKNRKFGVVYGKPIKVTKNENPTVEELEALQTVYVEKLTEIFNDYKAKYGYDEEETLVIV